MGTGRRYLGQRNMHERQVIHDRLAYANDHDGATATNGIGSRTNAAFNTGALENGLGSEVFLRTEKRPDGVSIALGIRAAIDLIDDAAGDEFFGEFQPPRFQIGNDYRMSTRGPGCCQGDQTNRSSTAYYDAAAEAEAGGLDAVHYD